MPRHRRKRRLGQSLISRLFLLVLYVGAGALVVVSIAAVTLSLVGNSASVAVAPPLDARAVATNPVVMGTVRTVDSPSRVTVQSGAETVSVQIIGIDDPPRCGIDSSLKFMRDELIDKQVTLISDPSVPQDTDDGRALYHVVMASQLSYSDAALLDGHVLAAAYSSWYKPVYEREQRDAQRSEEGVWGPPCDLQPPR